MDATSSDPVAKIPLPLRVALPEGHILGAISAGDLQDFAAWIPPIGDDILRVLGVIASLAVFNGLAGVQLWVPKGPCNNVAGARTWDYVTRIVGETAMCDLAHEWGGQCLEVPTLDALRKERRNRTIRGHFDRMTAPVPKGAGLSKARAVQELCLHFAPITWRQVEFIIDKPSAGLRYPRGTPPKPPALTLAPDDCHDATCTLGASVELLPCLA